jgi:UDP-2,3-diacylglucosamine pyrophosphatase LpxH
MRMIDGTLYCNDGDWVESLTALVEQPDGQLQIVDWSTAKRVAVSEPLQAGLRLA